MPQNCSVPFCHKKVYRENGNKISYFKFPEDKAMADAWVWAIRRDVGRNFQITKNSRVCSRHFKDSDYKTTLAGKRKPNNDAVPSIFVWKKSSPKKRKPPHPRETSKEFAKRPKKKGNKELKTKTELKTAKDRKLNCNTPSASSREISEKIQVETVTNESLSKLKEINEKLKEELQETSNALDAKTQKMKALENELNETKEQLRILTTRCQDYANKSFSFNQLKQSDKLINFYTGFPTVGVFNALFDYCDPGKDGENIRYWHSSATSQDITVLDESPPKVGRPRVLHPREELFITLCRLRQGFPEDHLAYLYGISQATVSRIVITWVNVLYLRFKDIPLWPSREMIDKYMPEQFKEKYPSTRVVIDCTEIKCQMPTSLLLNSELFSTYKNHTTLKALVGITPGGAFSFISQLYTGHISDREIVRRSGFLDQQFDSDDSVMADKGFTIEDLLPPGIKLNIPPFLGSQGQMSPEDVVKTQTVASLRVHVERAINKVKNFHIWDNVLPLNLFGIVNQMWTVCCILCNLQKPIISV